MIIGIPRALAYHRYGTLWETFFQELDIQTVTSAETNPELLTAGQAHSVDESCLPLKLYMGHVASLLERCDLLLCPRFLRFSRKEEFCVRFWGLPDMVETSFSQVRLLTYEQKSSFPGAEWLGFLQMAKVLGKSSIAAARAYDVAQSCQREADFLRFVENSAPLQVKGTKILVAAQSYVNHDPWLGGTVTRLVRDLGAVPVFVEGFERRACREAGRMISKDLYWTLNQEILGAIYLAQRQVDGILLLTAFPCGSEVLANELILRRVKELPVIQIILDEHQSQEGLATRIESFLDMIKGRRGVL